jgi:putative serine protease PepD
VILSVDGQPTRSPEDFPTALRPHKPGDTVTLTLRDTDRAERDIKVTLTDRPPTSR